MKAVSNLSAGICRCANSSMRKLVIPYFWEDRLSLTKSFFALDVKNKNSHTHRMGGYVETVGTRCTTPRRRRNQGGKRVIENEVQYQVTKGQLAKLQAAMQQLDQSGENQNVDPLLHQAEKDGLQSQIDELLELIRDFEARLDELPF